ncbi:MAG: VCBS repeat-containing protein, partial [Deltaproteobacteria bacterium]|nr:VCBS repeat-containing protein [Deltaproteobacteria bacterium]
MRLALLALIAASLLGCGPDGDPLADDRDNDGFDSNDDCDDTRDDVYPSAPEICDGHDNDCDGQVDEAGASGEEVFHADGDEDGFGHAEETFTACNAPEGYVANAEDCDDERSDVYPGAPEHCDEVDEDCDGEFDEEAVDQLEWFRDADGEFRDADGDGHGDLAEAMLGCTCPEGYVETSDDCDDLDPTSYPGAADACDGADNDCNGVPDDDPTWYHTFYTDDDGDGWGVPAPTVLACIAPEGYADNDQDCDDLVATTNPGADEVCDEVDNDCDEDVNEDDAIDAPTWYPDEDEDGYGAPTPLARSCIGPPDLVDDGRDCDDDDPDIHPDALETDCTDPVDYNCDGSVGYEDRDLDGYAACEDCDDLVWETHPDADELCDGADNDCDGEEDEGTPVDAPTWYLDGDEDDYGNSEISTRACDAPEGYVVLDGDCDDTDLSRYPTAPEFCDGVDNNCDGSIDEDNDALLDTCDVPPFDAEARCFQSECTMLCLDGAEDLNGDLQDPLGNGCEGPYAGPAFTDVTATTGISYIQWDRYAPDACGLPTGCSVEWFTGGAAAADFDGDGWTDLYVTRIHDTDILYRNKGDGTFEDVSQQVGLTLKLHSNGAVWGDIDNDGDLDLYVTAIGDERFFLFINEGGTFVEDAVARNAHVPSTSPHVGFTATFGDYDRDGWLDIHMNEWRRYRSSTEVRSHARLLRNLGSAGPGEFEDVTWDAGVQLDGISSTGVWSFTSAFTDLDQDGWPDLVISADWEYSKLFWNNGDGTFTDGTVAAGVGTDDSGMGTWVGDYDGDGWLDWFVTAIYDYENSCFGCSWAGMSGCRMYRNNGDRTFADRTDEAGVRNGYWAWGSALFDYDNDGDNDLVNTNGYTWGNSLYATDPMRFYRNEGGLYADLADTVGLGSDTKSGKAVVVFDYDQDGDLDLFVVNNGAQPRLYRNDGGNTNDWLRVRLVGRDRNLQGIGALITVHAT